MQIESRCLPLSERVKDTAALTPKKRSWVSRQKFDGEKEAHLML